MLLHLKTFCTAFEFGFKQTETLVITVQCKTFYKLEGTNK